MKNNEGRQPARSGSLHPKIVSDMLAAREFAAVRDRIMGGLYPARLARSVLRDTIVHSALIEFGCGRKRPASYFVGLCRTMATRSTVQREIARLATLGLLMTLAGEGGPRCGAVLPTIVLVDWFNENMPVITAEGDRLFKRAPLPVQPQI